MNKIVIVSVTGLCLLTFSVSALADREARSMKNHGQNGSSSRAEHRLEHRAQVRNERRSGSMAREKQQLHLVGHKRYQTDHRAVARRVARHQAARDYRRQHPHNVAYARHHKRDRDWVRLHSNSVRFPNRRDFYAHYYGHGNIFHYDQHRHHYEQHHGRHRKNSKVHSHGSDYLEWVSIMYLLNDIYKDDSFVRHQHHHRHN